ncbi:hypothetical protein NE237_015324 [Protea cynaroides]|uniref:Uncharacterized protein n=1 Tax=Protea cynaroides TaxID=273540 RepID=A0A9Q0QQZ0_9MAGN|nr:hypothetical protein NE237_015324 [Protea cynaroides]
MKKLSAQILNAEDSMNRETVIPPFCQVAGTLYIGGTFWSLEMLYVSLSYDFRLDDSLTFWKPGELGETTGRSYMHILNRYKDTKTRSILPVRTINDEDELEILTITSQKGHEIHDTLFPKVPAALEGLHLMASENRVPTMDATVRQPFLK